MLLAKYPPFHTNILHIPYPIPLRLRNSSLLYVVIENVLQKLSARIWKTTLHGPAGSQSKTGIKTNVTDIKESLNILHTSSSKHTCGEPEARYLSSCIPLSFPLRTVPHKRIRDLFKEEEGEGENQYQSFINPHLSFQASLLYHLWSSSPCPAQSCILGMPLARKLQKTKWYTCLEPFMISWCLWQWKHRTSHISKFSLHVNMHLTHRAANMPHTNNPWCYSSC